MLETLFLQESSVSSVKVIIMLRIVQTIPQPSQRPRLPPIERYCEGCCVEHLPRDCPIRREELAKQMPRTSLNNIEVIPSPNNSSEEEERPTLNVVTRAQSLRDKNTQTKSEKDSDKKTPKRRRRQRGSKEGKKKKRESEESSEGERKSNQSPNGANETRESKETARVSIPNQVRED